MSARIDGCGWDAPIVVSDNGAKQSDSPYRMDLIPVNAVLNVSAILKRGAVKYGEENWRGLTVKDHLNHALVHILAHLAGDTQENHLGNAACRALFALETQLNEK